MKTQCDQCESILNVPEATSGKKGRCPKCKQVFRIVPLEETSDDGLNLAALAGVETRAPSLIGQEGHCPTCGESIETGDRICVACGTDLKTGRKQKTVVEREEDRNPYQAKAKKREKPDASPAEPKGEKGRTRPGAVLISAAGASLLGVVAWILVATFAGYEFGFLALIIGILAGQGAKAATDRPCFRVGLLAASVAVCGIFLATYGSYYGFLHFGEGKEILRQKYENDKAFFQGVAPGTLSYPEYDEEKALAEANFWDFWMHREEDWAILLIFSGFGAAAAIRNGMGHKI